MVKSKKKHEINITIKPATALFLGLLLVIILILFSFNSNLGLFLESRYSTDVSVTSAPTPTVTESYPNYIEIKNQDPVKNQNQNKVSYQIVILANGNSAQCDSRHVNEVQSSISAYKNKYDQLQNDQQKWVDQSIENCEKLKQSTVDYCEQLNDRYDTNRYCDGTQVALDCLAEQKDKSTQLWEERKQQLEPYENSMLNLIKKYCKYNQ